MSVNRRLSFLILAGICFSLALVDFQMANAQDESQQHKATFTIGEKGDSDLEISSGLAITLKGPTYFYEIGLVDENEFEYDVWKLVQNPEVVEYAGLSEEQVELIESINSARKKELTKRITNNPTSDEMESELESQFLESELEIRSLLNDGQLTRFEQIKNQLNIQQVGFAKFLAARKMKEKLDLTTEDVEALGKSTEGLESRIKAGLKNAYKEANQELIAQLTDKQQSDFEALLDEKQKDQFWNTRLIHGDSSKSKIRPIATPDFLRGLIRIKSTRDQLEISDSQLEAMKQLKIKRDAEQDEVQKALVADELQQILNVDQYRSLMSLTILKETARWGTVNGLCGGTLGRNLELSEDDATRLFETGQELNTALIEKIQQSKLELWSGTLDSLPPATRKQIMSMIGKPTVFDFE